MSNMDEVARLPRLKATGLGTVMMLGDSGSIEVDIDDAMKDVGGYKCGGLADECDPDVVKTEAVRAIREAKETVFLREYAEELPRGGKIGWWLVLTKVPTEELLDYFKGYAVCWQVAFHGGHGLFCASIDDREALMNMMRDASLGLPS
jgi:hypothetical protein